MTKFIRQIDNELVLHFLWHNICFSIAQGDNQEWKEESRKMKRKKFSEWIVVILIILFFAIPVCSLAVADSVTTWPKCSTSFVYNLLFR